MLSFLFSSWSIPHGFETFKKLFPCIVKDTCSSIIFMISELLKLIHHRIILDYYVINVLHIILTRCKLDNRRLTVTQASHIQNIIFIIADGALLIYGIERLQLWFILKE